MGCSSTKLDDKVAYHQLHSVDDADTISGKIFNLHKGGIIVQTMIGNIQYGIPPETVKDALNTGIQVPEYYIIPEEKFDLNDGISLMDFEFPVYYNFFLCNRNKTKIICDAETKERIEIVFQETLLGPSNFSDFAEEFDDPEDMPNIVKELAHFSSNPFNLSEKLHASLFIEFLIWDKKNSVTIKKHIPSINKDIEVKIIKEVETYDIFQNNVLIASFSDTVFLKQSNFEVFKLAPADSTFIFEPPIFGITMLGTSHGFDECGSTSGFIIWINKKGVMVDPPPYSSRVLREQGIPPKQIDKIIITHCHADHDAGVFHKIIEASKIEFLSSKTILHSFLRKYSAISGLSYKELTGLFQYRTVKMNVPIYICGARFVFNYSFHSIPTLTFVVNYKGKSFYFSGDTCYAPDRLKKLYEEGLFTYKRYKFLAEKQFSKYACILHEAGIPPIHTPLPILSALKEEEKANLYLYHVAKKDVLAEYNLKTAEAGLDKSIVLIAHNEGDEDDSFMSNFDLLCSTDLIGWIPFNRITEIVDCFMSKAYKPLDVIIHADTVGDTFYIMKQGIVQIYSDVPDNCFSKLIYRGDYFGESSITADGTRLANVIAITDVIVLEIKANDFNWIFDYQPHKKTGSSYVNPLSMLRNLTEMRKAKSAELINSNNTIYKMTETQKCFLNMLLKEVKIKKDQVLWDKSQKANFCVIIKEGNFKIRVPYNKSYKEFIFTNGVLLGDFQSLLSKTECLSKLTSLSNGSVFKLSQLHLKEFLKQYPGFYIIIKNKYIIY